MVIAQNAVKNTDVIIREMMLLGMEQTFVINVQRSTKRRSEMDINGLGHITTEEMKEEILNLRQSLVKAVQNAECREGKKDEEIERLRKLVKEAYSEGWHDCYEHHKEYSILGDWYKSEIKLKVEQAPKEE